MSRLTAKQRSALVAVDRCYRTGPEILGRFNDFGQPTPESIEGLHATLASLVRRGLARKTKLAGVVHYEITDAGSAAR